LAVLTNKNEKQQKKFVCNKHISLARLKSVASGSFLTISEICFTNFSCPLPPALQNTHKTPMLKHKTKYQ
jgi:hypothetical protein